jgi:hypothetical protein
MPAGIAAATSAVPTSATIHVSTNPATVAEAIEAIIGRARREISCSPSREGYFMQNPEKWSVSLDKSGRVVAEF